MKNKPYNAGIKITDFLSFGVRSNFFSNFKLSADVIQTTQVKEDL